MKMKLKFVPLSSSCSLAAAAVLCDSNSNYNYNKKKRHSSMNMIVYSSSSKSSSKKNDSSNSNSNSNSQPTPTPTPPRITSNAKQNLRFLKIWKEYQKRKSSTPRPSTSYRKKKKAEKEDLADDQTDLYRDPTTSLYYTNQLGLGGLIDNAAAVPVLLVDGYNVCGYWMKLKKHFLNGKLELARQKLIDELITFSMLREVKVVVVFDAMMSGFPNHKEEYSSGIDIVFSTDASADTWIEKEVSALKEDGCPKVWVVTSDHCQQQAAHGAGAFVWSSKALVTEIKASQKEVEEMLQEQRSTSFQGRLLKHNLDAEVVDALKNLRQKLSDNELK